GYRFARVTDIRDVQDKRYGWKVKGRIVVDGDQGYRGHRGYDRYDRYDRRGRDYRRGGDEGKFTCYIQRGRYAEVDFKGIRGLR
ncbi:MAG: hypothetical protein KJO02_00020, partial [Erythrobacter sp.]|nr:hypothetical protein [Erythrobacter sp.]